MLNLIQASGPDERTFLVLTYEVWVVTKQDGRHAQRKMAYYFTVLRDRLGLGTETPL